MHFRRHWGRNAPGGTRCRQRCITGQSKSPGRAWLRRGGSGRGAALALGRRGEAASVAWGRCPRMRPDVRVPPVTPFPLPLATRGSNTRDCRITCYVTAISPDPASKVHRPLRPTRRSLWAGVRLFARPLGRPFPRTPLRSAPRGLLGQHVTVAQYVLGVVIFNSFLIYLKS